MHLIPFFISLIIFNLIALWYVFINYNIRNLCEIDAMVAHSVISVLLRVVRVFVIFDDKLSSLEQYL